MTRKFTSVTNCGIQAKGFCFKFRSEPGTLFPFFSFGPSFDAKLQILATGLLKLSADLYLFGDIQGRADAMFLPPKEA